MSKYTSLMENNISDTLRASYDRKRGFLMFLDDLSISLIRLCDAEDLSYERASERCKCSSKHFANIVHRNTHPTLKIFEQICHGFQKTPNLLLRIGTDELEYRLPMPVVEVREYSAMSGRVRLPVCPQCRHTLGREAVAFCSECGQCLSWKQFKRIAVGGRFLC